MEQEDLDRYHHSIMNNSMTMVDGTRSEMSNLCFMADEIRSVANDDASKAQELFNDSMLQFRDETKSAMAELKSQLSVVLSILQDLNNQDEATPISPTPQAANEIGELAGQFQTKSHENYIDCDSLEGESIRSLNENIVEPSADNVFDEMSRPLPIELKEDYGCSVLGKMNAHNNAPKVFAVMTEPFVVEYSLDTAVTKAAHKVLDERPVLSPVALDGDFNGKKDSLSPYSYIIESGSSVDGSSWISGILISLFKVITHDLNYVDDILGVSVANSQSLSKLRFNPQVFDPGTLAFFKHEEYVSQLNANESQLHCISSELFLVYSQMYGEFSSYNDTVIELCRYLFEWARSWNGKIDWVLSLCISQELLSWTCSSLLWSCNIARDDIFINSNDISTLPHANLSNRPFADSCDGALAQICPTFDQAAPSLSNGHDIGAKNASIYLKNFDMFNLRVPFGEKHCHILFSLFRLITRGLACCLPGYISMRIGLLSPRLVHFAWDQGLCAIFAYILEDKDNFKWVGDSILVMVMIRSIRDGQIKIHMKYIQEGFNSMTTWRNGTTCTLTNFIFPGNHVPGKQNEVPKLFNKIIGLSPSGESYSQNKGPGTDNRLFDETAESFLIKLETCVGPNKNFRLSVAELLKYLRYERLASEILDAFSESVEIIMPNGVEPKPVAMVNGLAACGQLRALNMRVLVHDFIKTSAGHLVAIFGTSLIDMYCKYGKTDEALEVYQLMEEKNVCTRNALIKGFALVQIGLVHDFLQTTLCSNILMNGDEWNLQTGECWSTWNMIHESNMLRVLNEDPFGQYSGPKHFQQHLSIDGYVGTDATEFLKAILFPSLGYWKCIEYG